ncbi:MAG: ABC transporter substrate-binding protein [Pseudomonadota bacterium]
MKRLFALALIMGGAPAAALECDAGMRAFTHAAGEDCIPADPQRIVTLQDQNALLPLMELGVTPVASLGHIQTDGTQIFRRMDGYDTSAVEWVGPYGGPIDPEAIAAMEPDLIVASPWPPDAREMLADIAPVVVIDMFENPLDVALMQFADLVNKTERAEELRAEFQAKADAVRAELGPQLATTTASFLTYDADDDRFYPTNPTQALGMVLGALDPIRPAPEQGLGPER